MVWFATIDQAKLNFDQNGLLVLNIILGLIMFGVSLDLSISDFKKVLNYPKSVLVGLFTQLLLLPALTFVLVWVLQPQASIAMGMILVAACPGGNVSNFITHLSKGNTEISVSMTAVCTITAVFTTPFNLTFWGSLYPPTRSLLKQVSLDPIQILGIVFLLLILPLALGMFVSARFPNLAARLKKPFKIGSILFFLLFIGIAFSKNIDYFLEFVQTVFLIVLIHNALAFSLGYLLSSIAGLPLRDRRALTVEVGIQNSGLGLILIFTFFDGLGGMAIIAAWWGIWHIVAGLSLASFWSRRELA